MPLRRVLSHKKQPRHPILPPRNVHPRFLNTAQRVCLRMHLRLTLPPLRFPHQMRHLFRVPHRYRAKQAPRNKTCRTHLKNLTRRNTAPSTRGIPPQYPHTPMRLPPRLLLQRKNLRTSRPRTLRIVSGRNLPQESCLPMPKRSLLLFPRPVLSLRTQTIRRQRTPTRSLRLSPHPKNPNLFRM